MTHVLRSVSHLQVKIKGPNQGHICHSETFCFTYCCYICLQVTELEFACNQHEAKIIACEEENRELKGEIDKHRQIAALINSLSSGGDKSEGNNTSK